MVVGAYIDKSPNITNSGKTYTLKNRLQNGYKLLFMEILERSDNYGSFVLLRNDEIVVAAKKHETDIIGNSLVNSDNSPNHGAVYTYKYEGSEWTLKSRIVAHDKQEYDSLGASLQFYKNHLIIGAPNNDGGAYNPAIPTWNNIEGEAYIHTFLLTLEQKADLVIYLAQNIQQRN